MAPIPLSSLVLDAALGVAWIVGYVLWSRRYWRAIDPWVRRRVGRWVGAEIVWEYRERNSGRAFDFRPRWGGWQWGVAGGRDGALLQAGAVRIANVVVMLVAGLWPIALLLYATAWARVIAAVVAYPLFFLIAPLYVRYWHGDYGVRHMPGATERAAE